MATIFRDSTNAVVRAPAKVNLSLHVTGKRADGYHDLDSIMLPVSVYDEIALGVAPSRRTSITCTVRGPEKVPGGDGNLAARAARAVCEALGEPLRVSIRLRKVIPFGAGLGGGSSDAAAVVRVLPRLAGRRLDRKVQLAIARSLGADVPFFLDCVPAQARGIGDILRPLPRIPAGALAILVPPERVETAWAYRHALPRLTCGTSASSFRGLPRNIDAVEAWFSNDFQRGVEQAFGSVRRARQSLERLGARATVLSGSGSAVVGWFATRRLADAAAAAYDGPGTIFAAKVIGGAPRPEAAGNLRRTSAATRRRNRYR